MILSWISRKDIREVGGAQRRTLGIDGRIICWQNHWVEKNDSAVHDSVMDFQEGHQGGGRVTEKNFGD